ncbi:two-component system, chemotaxis family, sensor kinase CheA [Limimonas halophila]|uniref:Chemotaxis protein CheA n=1 Tax=Limimonas halophila TaxID=1082479 RepID=A0A1G7M2C1_9PROT|nr:chemotaxis protein CheW [Limimonas halophila]SDF55978.1 two-component system, chemotaxis family, sensor kinase CheA [Limimonas halophila]
MDDLLSEFLTETNESLQVLDTEIVTLEQNPNNPDLLHNIFRVMHTIKGTCGFLGLPRLEAVAHSGETVLGKVRDGELEINQDRVSIVLECLDRIRDIVGALEENGEEPEGDDTELINRLNALIEKAEAGDTGDSGGEAAAGGEAEAESGAGAEEDDMAAAMAAMEAEDSSEAEAESDAAESGDAGQGGEGDAPAGDSESQPESSGPPAPASQTQPATTSESQPPAASSGGGGQGGGSGQGGGKSGGDSGRQGGGGGGGHSGPQSIRVSVDLLESLMTTVSELVLNRNQLLQILRQYNESEFAAPLQRLNHVVSELQEGVMKTRMQPIDNAWSKLPRIVRDLSADLGKKIELKKKGEDTELDRQVLELIKDPLTHMVRNSCDHGLETPDERREAGKPEVGTIALNAYHEGGHIIIEIADDGKGLDPEKIKDKAIRNGLTTEADCANLTEQQILQFIFKPGFSTAAAVTAVSGRGVGMDVVRNNIEEIGGTIELSSKLGRGSKFTVKIPLTLAIASALIVECGGERFAIPQLSVKELVRAKGDSEKSIERIKDTPVLRLRDRLLPLINLRQLLRLDGEDQQPQLESPAGAGQETATQSGDPQSEERDGFIVVSQVGTYHFGIIVDQVYDTEEIVVKPVARILRNIPLFSGNTILGDGRVVMILDPNGIAQASGEITVSEGQDMGEEERAVSEDEAVSMLIFRAVDDAPKAVPLGLVSRLEEIDLENVEVSNGQRVIQYRGKLMPLILMDGAKGLESQGKQPVLVFTDQNRSMGLVVDEIVDIVQESMNIELSGERAGFLGSAVIAGKATDIIDTGYYLTKAYPDWFRGEERRGQSRRGLGRRVLFVDDSPFFRNMLVPVLDTAGYDVTSAESAERALELHNEGRMYDVIISDIEMSGMSGYEFAEYVQNQTDWASTPMIALSSYAEPQDMERGRAAGFRDYVAKFDRETLLDTLREILNEEKLPQRGAA